MKPRRAIVAIFAFGILFVTPSAWGCEGTDMQNCSMSDCPMVQERPVEGCHESAAPSQPDSSGCDTESASWIACCDAPLDREPAKTGSASIWDQSATPLVVLAERVELQPPARPPDGRSEAVSAQWHELGRYTLLSSFLL